MTITEAERQVIIERRRKRKALPGRRQEAAFRLKMAVTLALQCAGSLRSHPYERAGKAT